MEENTQIDLKNIESYKTKKLITFFKTIPQRYQEEKVVLEQF